MSRPPVIYLDSASTTPLDPRVAEAMHQAFLAGYANPASQHAGGRAARRVLEDVRESIYRLLMAQSRTADAVRLLFTSGGTEANNLALEGLTASACRSLIVSAIEHPSVMAAAERLRQRNFPVSTIRVDHSGVVDLHHLRELLSVSPRPALASIMFGNNETGVLQPLGDIVPLAREFGALVHTDAVQAVGKVGVAFDELGVDALTLAPHKFHGPLGVGGLLLRSDLKIEPLLVGGFQQGGLRPGTESVAFAVGFAESLRLALAESDETLQTLRDSLEQSLIERLAVVVNSAAAPRLPHIANIAFPGVDRQPLFLALDLAGVACSTGSACASGSSEPSPVLQAMGVSSDVISSSLRFSVSRFNTRAEMMLAVERISNTVKHLQRRVLPAK
jgi:cysteine desulfurase